MPRWYTRPKTVTHPGTNRARRALTSFMRRTPLTTTPRRQQSPLLCDYYSICASTNAHKSVLSFLRQLTTWHCPHLAAARRCTAAAADRRPAGRAAIGRYLLPPGPQQQTRSSGVRRSNGTDGQTDEQTDGRTQDSFIEPAPLCRQCQ